MSKYLFLGLAGYLMGMRHRQLRKQLCLARMKKHACRMMNLF